MKALWNLKISNEDRISITKINGVLRGSKAYCYILDNRYGFKSHNKRNDILTVHLKWEKIHIKVFSVTHYTKLRWFQFRLISQILTTITFLHLFQ